MSDMSLVKTRIRGGFWEGVLTVSPGTVEPPRLSVTHLGTEVSAVDVQADPDRPGAWTVRVAIPPDRLADGVQTFLIHTSESDEALAQFAVISGAAGEDDIRVELDLLRAELDLLKRAFRRHCAEAM